MIDKNRLSDDTETSSRTDRTAIECPHCGTDVEVTEALAKTLRSQLESEYKARDRRRTAKVKAELEALELKQIALTSREEALDAEIEKRTAAVRAEEHAKAAKAADDRVAMELTMLRSEAETTKAALEDAKAKELEHLKEKADLEQARRDIELTVARQVAEQRDEIRKAAAAAADEEHRLDIAQRDTQIASMKAQIEDLRRKADQGSQQTQGEALELTLEELLAREFPMDVFEPVPKGVTGADLIQRVRSDTGIECGTILWEAKRTKHWTAGWLPKLRDDQRALKAEVAALVSTVLPRGARPIQQVDGVWVSGFATATGLAQVLRHGLLQAATAKQALVGRSEKVELLYAYFAGPEFKARIEGLLEPFLQMREDLEKEKRAVTRTWAKRDKQIDRALTSLSGMYGDLQGIAGATIPGLEALDLPALEEGDDA